MALKRMGIVENYERNLECTMLTMWHWEGEKRGREDLESRLKRGGWMGGEMKEEAEIMVEGRPSFFWSGH